MKKLIYLFAIFSMSFFAHIVPIYSMEKNEYHFKINTNGQHVDSYFDITLKKGSIIKDLKEKIMEETGIPINQQKLIVAGKIIPNDEVTIEAAKANLGTGFGNSGHVWIHNLYEQRNAAGLSDADMSKARSDFRRYFQTNDQKSANKIIEMIGHNKDAKLEQKLEVKVWLDLLDAPPTWDLNFFGSIEWNIPDMTRIREQFRDNLKRGMYDDAREIANTVINNDDATEPQKNAAKLWLKLVP